MTFALFSAKRTGAEGSKPADYRSLERKRRGTPRALNVLTNHHSHSFLSLFHRNLAFFSRSSNKSTGNNPPFLQIICPFRNHPSLFSQIPDNSFILVDFTTLKHQCNARVVSWMRWVLIQPVELKYASQNESLLLDQRANSGLVLFFLKDEPGFFGTLKTNKIYIPA